MKEHVCVRWCVASVIAEPGHVSDDTRAHPVAEASIVVGDADDGDGAATSPSHVFPTSLARCSLALIGATRSRDLMLYFSSPSLRQLRLRRVSLWD